MDNGRQWVLVNSQHPYFNLWQLVNDEGPLYIESFRKDINPNLNHSFEELNHDQKIEYITKCLDEGEMVEELALRLNADYRGIMNIQRKYIQSVNTKKN